MGTFWISLFSIWVFVFTAVCIDRGVTVEEFEKAVSKCPENGGLKVYQFDIADATVTCNNGAVFYYKLGDKKQ